MMRYVGAGRQGGGRRGQLNGLFADLWIYKLHFKIIPEERYNQLLKATYANGTSIYALET